MAKSGKRRWGKEEDAKLAQLFRTPHNGVDPSKLDIKTVKAVHEKYFPDFLYRNFAPLYRDKARDFSVDQSLKGHRASKLLSASSCCRFVCYYCLRMCCFCAGSKAAKAQADGVNLEDISDDENDPYEEGEDKESEEDLEEEDEEEEDTMPPKKTPPRKKAAPSAPSSAAKLVDEGLTDQMEALNLSKTPL
jgi:hypothetical protein